MEPNVSDSKFIQFQAPPDVQDMLAQIAAKDGEKKSITIRRLIRDEAQRRGIESVSQSTSVESMEA
jgi:hypothetical protein